MEGGGFGGMDLPVDTTMKIEFEYDQPVSIEPLAEAQADEPSDFEIPLI